MKFRIILCRHSQSVHNRQKLNIKYHQDKKEYKQSSQYIKIKYNKQLIDRNQINLQEINKIQQLLKNNQIGLIIVSPINRCIETALMIKKISKQCKNAEIVVDTLITSRISSAWSIGESLQVKKQNYGKQVDFRQCKQNIHWCIDILLSDNNNTFKQYYLSKISQNISYQQLILEHIHTNQPQSNSNVIDRVMRFKNKLSQIYMKQTNKQILIISHNNILKTLIGDKLNSKGKIQCDVSFGHLQLLYCIEQYILGRKEKGNDKGV